MMHCITMRLLLLICLGQKDALGSDIIHGAKAQKKTFLYMASVQNYSMHMCGGFLINKNFVITAAHCDLYREYTKMSVVLGTHNIKSVEKAMRYDVKICEHDFKKDTGMKNDIMLLKLNTSANLSKLLKTIELPKEDKIIKANTKCHVAGWGLTETGNVVDELRVVGVSTIDLKECQDQWKNLLPDNVLCAGGYGTHKGACQGDSGGPLVCNKKAVVIVSFNRNGNCKYPDFPNVYTEISKFLPWINKIQNTC